MASLYGGALKSWLSRNQPSRAKEIIFKGNESIHHISDYPYDYSGDSQWEKQTNKQTRKASKRKKGRLIGQQQRQIPFVRKQ